MINLLQFQNSCLCCKEDFDAVCLLFVTVPEHFVNLPFCQYSYRALGICEIHVKQKISFIYKMKLNGVDK